MTLKIIFFSHHTSLENVLRSFRASIKTGLYLTDRGHLNLAVGASSVF